MATPQVKDLVLRSPAGSSEVITFVWPLQVGTGQDKHDNGIDIIDTIKFVCDELPSISSAFEEINLNQIDTACYKTMTNLVDRFNKAVDSIVALEKGTSLPAERLNKFAHPSLLRHILQLVYNAAVLDPDKLNNYEPFSPEVYGETSYELVQQMIKHVTINGDDTFIDLGSGVGQVVLQMAGSFPLKACIGIEKADTPARYAERMDMFFRQFMAWFGKRFCEYKLIKGDFLVDEHREKITSSTLVFVNNFAFGPNVDHQLKERFADLRDGARVVSSKSFCPLNFRITDRNLSDIGTIMHVSEIPPLKGSVSWTCKPVSYYLHVIDRTILERYFQRIKTQKGTENDHTGSTRTTRDRAKREAHRDANSASAQQQNANSNSSSSFRDSLTTASTLRTNSPANAAFTAASKATRQQKQQQQQQQHRQRTTMSDLDTSTESDGDGANGNGNASSNGPMTRKVWSDWCSSKGKSSQSDDEELNNNHHNSSNNNKAPRTTSAAGRGHAGIAATALKKRKKLTRKAAIASKSAAAAQREREAAMAAAEKEGSYKDDGNSSTATSLTAAAAGAGSASVNGAGAKGRKGRMKKGARGRKNINIAGLDVLHSRTLLSTSVDVMCKKLPAAPGCVDQQLTSLLTHNMSHTELDIPEAPQDTPYALQILLDLFRSQYMAMIDEMRSKSFVPKIKQQIKFEQERMQRIKNRASQLEKQIRVLIDDSVALLKVRMNELGISVSSPNDLIAKAKEIVGRHKELQCMAKRIQSQVTNCEMEQKRLLRKHLQQLPEYQKTQGLNVNGGTNGTKTKLELNTAELSETAANELVLREIANTLAQRKKLYAQVSSIEKEAATLEKVADEQRTAAALLAQGTNMIIATNVTTTAAAQQHNSSATLTMLPVPQATQNLQPLQLTMGSSINAASVPNSNVATLSGQKSATAASATAAAAAITTTTKASRRSRDHRSRSQEWPDVPDVGKIEESNPEVLAQKILEKGRQIEAGKIGAAPNNVVSGNNYGVGVLNHLPSGSGSKHNYDEKPLQQQQQRNRSGPNSRSSSGERHAMYMLAAPQDSTLMPAPAASKQQQQPPTPTQQHQQQPQALNCVRGAAATNSISILPKCELPGRKSLSQVQESPKVANFEDRLKSIITSALNEDQEQRKAHHQPQPVINSLHVSEPTQQQQQQSPAPKRSKQIATTLTPVHQQQQQQQQPPQQQPHNLSNIINVATQGLTHLNPNTTISPITPPLSVNNVAAVGAGGAGAYQINQQQQQQQQQQMPYGSKYKQQHATATNSAQQPQHQQQPALKYKAKDANHMKYAHQQQAPQQHLSYAHTAEMTALQHHHHQQQQHQQQQQQQHHRRRASVSAASFEQFNAQQQQHQAYMLAAAASSTSSQLLHGGPPAQHPSAQPPQTTASHHHHHHAHNLLANEFKTPPMTAAAAASNDYHHAHHQHHHHAQQHPHAHHQLQQQQRSSSREQLLLLAAGGSSNNSNDADALPRAGSNHSADGGVAMYYPPTRERLVSMEGSSSCESAAAHRAHSTTPTQHAAEAGAIAPPSRPSSNSSQPDYTQVSPAKMALRRHLSQEKLNQQVNGPTGNPGNHPPMSTSAKTIGDLVNGEIERTLEISHQSIINAVVNMSTVGGAAAERERSYMLERSGQAANAGTAGSAATFASQNTHNDGQRLLINPNAQRPERVHVRIPSPASTHAPSNDYVDGVAVPLVNAHGRRSKSPLGAAHNLATLAQVAAYNQKSSGLVIEAATGSGKSSTARQHYVRSGDISTSSSAYHQQPRDNSNTGVARSNSSSNPISSRISGVPPSNVRPLSDYQPVALPRAEMKGCIEAYFHEEQQQQQHQQHPTLPLHKANASTAGHKERGSGGRNGRKNNTAAPLEGPAASLQDFMMARKFKEENERRAAAAAANSNSEQQQQQHHQYHHAASQLQPNSHHYQNHVTNSSGSAATAQQLTPMKVEIGVKRTSPMSTTNQPRPSKIAHYGMHEQAQQQPLQAQNHLHTNPYANTNGYGSAAATQMSPTTKLNVQTYQQHQQQLQQQRNKLPLEPLLMSPEINSIMQDERAMQLTAAAAAARHQQQLQQQHMRTTTPLSVASSSGRRSTNANGGPDDDDDETHWQHRVSCDFDRLIALASTELDKTRRSIDGDTVPASISCNTSPDSGITHSSSSSSNSDAARTFLSTSSTSSQMDLPISSGGSSSSSSGVSSYTSQSNQQQQLTVQPQHHHQHQQMQHQHQTLHQQREQQQHLSQLSSTIDHLSDSSMKSCHSDAASLPITIKTTASSPVDPSVIESPPLSDAGIPRTPSPSVLLATPTPPPQSLVVTALNNATTAAAIAATMSHETATPPPATSSALSNELLHSGNSNSSSNANNNLRIPLKYQRKSKTSSEKHYKKKFCERNWKFDCDEILAYSNSTSDAADLATNSSSHSLVETAADAAGGSDVAVNNVTSMKNISKSSSSQSPTKDHIAVADGSGKSTSTQLINATSPHRQNQQQQHHHKSSKFRPKGKDWDWSADGGSSISSGNGSANINKSIQNDLSTSKATNELNSSSTTTASASSTTTTATTTKIN